MISEAILIPKIYARLQKIASNFSKFSGEASRRRSRLRRSVRGFATLPGPLFPKFLDPPLKKAKSREIEQCMDYCQVSIYRFLGSLRLSTLNAFFRRLAQAACTHCIARLWAFIPDKTKHCRIVRVAFNQSINLICIRQPEPIVAKPNICKNKKQTKHYTTITTQTDPRKGKLEHDICCRSSHLNFPVIYSNRGKANSFNIMVTL